MNNKRVVNLISNLYGLINNIKKIKNSGQDIENFDLHLRTAEYKLLEAIDAVKQKDESERAEVKNETIDVSRCRS